MKIKLLNDGGYWACKDLEFPIEVESEHIQYTSESEVMVQVPVDILKSLGADISHLNDYPLCFWVGEEAEVLDEG